MVDIPKPVDSGSSGKQATSTANELFSSESPLEGLSIAQTVQGLAATRSRSMGGEIAANLIAGSFNQLSFELQETKAELRETHKQLHDARQELGECKTTVAVLQGQLDTSFHGRHLKNLSITVGTVIMSFGIELYRSNVEKLPYVAWGLGALMILLGWISREGGLKK